MKGISFVAGLVIVGLIVVGVASYMGKDGYNQNIGLASKSGATIKCSDSDNGLNTQIKGTCTNAKVSYSDSCANPTSVNEYYCGTKQHCTSTVINCPSGYSCVNGACVQSTNTSCTPNWSCTGWSTCDATYSSTCSNSATGAQTRTCTDSNNCGTTSGKPSESQSCTITRNTDGTSCGTTQYGACSATSCGASGTQSITSYSCSNATCQSSTSSQSCTGTACPVNQTCSVGTCVSNVTNVTCTSNWSCTSWSTCTNGTQTRTCTDSNSCGTTSGKPAESQSCTTSATWKISTVDTQGWAPRTSTRAINSNTVFTAYSIGPTSANNLKFAKSTDGGATWTKNTIVTVDNVIGYPSLYAVNESVVFVSYFSGFPNYDFMVAKSTDGGATWTTTRVFDGVSVIGATSIYAVDSQNIFVTYSPNDKDLWLAKSVDGGNSWTTQLVQAMDSAPGFLGRFSSIYAVNVNTILIAYDYEQTGSGWDTSVYETRFAKSVDGGNSWTITKVDVNNDAAGFTSMDVIGSNNIFVAYAGDQSKGVKFAKSTDGGATWQIQTLYPTDDYGAISLDAIDTSTIFIAAHDWLSPQKVDFAKSSDSGTTWSTQIIVSGGTQGHGASVSAANQNKIFVSFGSYTDNSLKMAVYG